MSTFTNRSEVLAQADRLLSEKPFSRESRSKFDALLSRAAEMRADEERAIRAAELGRELRTEKSAAEEQRARAFSTFLRGDGLTLDEETRTSLSGAMAYSDGAYPGASDGATVPVGFYERVTSAAKQTDELLDPAAITVIATPRGGPHAFPFLDDTTSSATVIQQTALSDTRPLAATGRLQLPKCPTWRTGIVPISREYFQDAPANFFDSLLADAFGVRLARGIGAANVAALMAAASSSGQAIIGDDNATTPDPTQEVGYLDLVNLMSSVDPAYIASPKCAWAMNFSTLLSLFRLKDLVGRTLLPIDGRFTLFGKPIRICPSMDSIAQTSPVSARKPIAFGDFGRLVMRTVTGSMVVRRLDERYAEFDVIGFEGYWRAQADLIVTGGSSPVKYIELPATV